MLKKPVKNNVVVVGSLDICGNIIDVEDVEEKIKTAIDNGFETIIVPDSNYSEKVVLDTDKYESNSISLSNNQNKISDYDNKSKNIFLNNITPIKIVKIKTIQELAKFLFF